ncbi:MAG: hypothetical protein H7X91_08765 [Burkholderiales bacterium]|nr:hypothetical protein [Burkholderiales bacterium]
MATPIAILISGHEFRRQPWFDRRRGGGDRRIGQAVELVALAGERCECQGFVGRGGGLRNGAVQVLFGHGQASSNRPMARRAAAIAGGAGGVTVAVRGAGSARCTGTATCSVTVTEGAARRSTATARGAQAAFARRFAPGEVLRITAIGVIVFVGADLGIGVAAFRACAAP